MATTATAIRVTSAPTEAEIRSWVVDHGTYPGPAGLTGQMAEIIAEWANSVKCGAYDALESEEPREDSPAIAGSWRDLRPSEAVVLRDLVVAAEARAVERCRSLIIEELTTAGVAFATAYPEAPWTPLNSREPVTA